MSRPVAVVTGAGSGIGRNVTHALLDDGWAVVTCRPIPDPAPVTTATGRLIAMCPPAVGGAAPDANASRVSGSGARRRTPGAPCMPRRSRSRR